MYICMYVCVYMYVFFYVFVYLCMYLCMYMCKCVRMFVWILFQEKYAGIRESVHLDKLKRYNPKHECPMLNGYGDNGQRKAWSSCGATHFTCQLTILSISDLECGVI